MYALAASSWLLTACQVPLYVTGPNYPTEAALVANAYKNGLSAEADIHYQQAYLNLRQAYQRCIAFTSEEAFVFTDHKLEEFIALGTLFARTRGGAYLHKTTVEGLADGRTRITLFVPKQYRFAQQRFQQDIRRALGQDPACNIRSAAKQEKL